MPRQYTTNVRILNTEEFSRALKARAIDIEVQSGRNLLIVAQEVARQARHRVAKDTHETEKGISASELGRDLLGMYVDIESEDEASKFLEYGTRHMDKRPFLRPSLAFGRRKFATQMRQIR